MTAAGWFPADPITFKSSVRIAVDSVFRKPDVNAPVSNLYLFDRKQALAFEQPVGVSMNNAKAAIAVAIPGARMNVWEW